MNDDRFRELQDNLNKVLQQGKEKQEAERIKKIEENKEKDFNKDEFIYELQSKITSLEEKERI